MFRRDESWVPVAQAVSWGLTAALQVVGDLLPLLFLIHVYHPLRAEVIYPDGAREELGRKGD